MLRFILTTAVISLATLHASANCDPVVRQLRTRHLPGTSFCQIQQRYEAALETLKQKGVSNPDRVGNIFATRFINSKDWQAYLLKNQDSPFAAWKVYSPSPTTWSNWNRALDYMMTPQTQKVWLEGSESKLESWLLELHRIEMSSLLPSARVGKFRTDVEEILPLHSVKDAYTFRDILRVRSTPYFSASTLKRLTSFQFQVCEDIPQIESRVASNLYLFQDPTSSILRSCGDLTMAPYSVVKEQLRLWILYVQKGMRILARAPERMDVLAFAAKVEQWFVMIHPFVDGNGRTARLMMDQIFTQLHLPAPVLTDMDRDFFSTPDAWADLIGKGLVNSVEAAERCATDPLLPGCLEVSQQPPSQNLEKK